jgi:hypothetical protein
MKALVLVMLGCAAAAGAMGFTEDPQEKLTRSWDWEAVKTLEIRGEVDFELVPGSSPKVTVVTTRALFDQLTVSNWWGAATVAIESGLRGPRELGAVKVIIVLPALQELAVSDKSNGRGVWPSNWGKLRVSDRSTLDFVLEGTNFSVETSWLTKVTLGGRVSRLTAGLRHQSHVDASSLEVKDASVTLDEESTFEAGPTGAGSGTARHGSRVVAEAVEPWRPLLLREDARLEARAQP